MVKSPDTSHSGDMHDTLTRPTAPGRRTVRRTVRRDAIDVTRSLALLVVVLGHLSLAVVDRHGGEVRGANLLTLLPGWSWIAVAAPMPVFFAAAGWANATTDLGGSTKRLRTLVGLAAVVVGLWSTAVIAFGLLTGGADPVAGGARIATQPLWFLAAYLPLAAAGGVLARLVTRHPLASVGGCLGFLAVADITRFGLHGPAWIGWVGFLVAWSVPWLLGAWWRGRWESGGFPEKAMGAALLGGFGVLATLLVAFGGYQPSLIDVVPGGRSNTSPPTLYTAVVAVAQIGVLMLLARSLDTLGRRTRRLWDRLGEASVGVYLWHLSALALCAALLAVGLPAFERLTTAWWLSRPVWFAMVLGVTALLVGASAAVRRKLTPSGSVTTGRSRSAVAGVGDGDGRSGARRCARSGDPDVGSLLHRVVRRSLVDAC